MTKINKIENTYKKPLINPKNTGYAAAGAIALSGLRLFSKAKPVVKSHKFISFIAIALTLLHIGNVEYLHHKYRKM